MPKTKKLLSYQKTWWTKGLKHRSFKNKWTLYVKIQCLKFTCSKRSWWSKNLWLKTNIRKFTSIKKKSCKTNLSSKSISLRKRLKNARCSKSKIPSWRYSTSQSGISSKASNKLKGSKITKAITNWFMSIRQKVILRRQRI